MLTLVITGLAMGTTVTLARAIGSGDKRPMKRTIANTVVLFTSFFCYYYPCIVIITGKYSYSSVNTGRSLSAGRRLP